MSGSHKGSGFERDLCRQLSSWWTGGTEDDLFWRTASSGGRATIRHRKGKRTAGQYGDICATDDRGAPLLQWLTIEAKRGYSRVDILGVLDSNKAQHELCSFIEQAEREAREAHVPFFLIVFKRDRGAPMVIAPWKLYCLVASWHGWRACVGPGPLIRFRPSAEPTSYVVCRLDGWLAAVSPAFFKQTPYTTEG